MNKVCLLIMMCLQGFFQASAHQESPTLNNNEIQKHEAQFNKIYNRASRVKTVVMVSATIGLVGMVYWWMRGEGHVVPAGQKEFLDYFNALPDSQKLVILQKGAQAPQSFSMKSLFRTVLPHAVQTAATGVIAQALRLILLRPLASYLDSMWTKPEIELFISQEKRLSMIFEALPETALYSVDSDFHTQVFNDLKNELVLHMERIIAFMEYEMHQCAEDEDQRAQLHKLIDHLRSIIEEAVSDMNIILANRCSESRNLLRDRVVKFREEFGVVIKQLKVVEALWKE